jgi:hypothetical protein
MGHEYHRTSRRFTLVYRNVNVNRLLETGNMSAVKGVEFVSDKMSYIFV